MNRRRLILLFPIFLLVGILALPPLLRTVPSRYVARLPEPLQRLGAPRQQAAILPTAAFAEDADRLLGKVLAQAELGELSQSSAPSTPTPPAVSAATASDSQAGLGNATQTPVPPTPTPTPFPSPTPIPIPASWRLNGIGHIFQTWNNCGPATLAMTLSYFDIFPTQSDTASWLKPNPEDRNVSPHEMVGYVREETSLAAITRANGNLDTVRRLLSNNIPVILEIGIDPPGEFRWLGWYGHYLLLVAYDDAAQQFWVYDSWFGTSETPLENADPGGRVLSYADVSEYWPQFNRSYIAVYRPEQADLVAEIIGSDMSDTNMWRNALDRVRTETGADPSSAFNWFNLGTVYNALGRHEDAAAAFDQARAIGLPWRMLWYQFGPYEAYYQVKRYEDVILLADVTLKDRPYFEESYYYRGAAKAALGQLDSAREDFQRAVAFNPNFGLAVTALSQIEN